MRRQRLEEATRPAFSHDADDAAALAGNADPQPIYPGVVQRGPVAYAQASNTPLAVAPQHWTEGCAVHEHHVRAEGPRIVVRSYLEPVTGAALYVETVPEGEPRSFETCPARWANLRVP